MSAETLVPDVLLAQTELSGVVGDIDDDPDSPDGLWLTASGNNVNTDARVSFGTPTGDPTVGVDLQEFRALVRQFDEAQTGQPNARIELWENGALVRAGTDETVPDGGVVVSFTWNASELGTADGSLVECKIVGTKSGGSPGARNSVEVGAVEWNAEVTSGVLVTPPKIALSLTVYPPLVTASDHQVVTPPKKTLALTTYAPTVTVGIRVTPPKTGLGLTTYPPAVSVTEHKLLTPPKTALVLAVYPPVVTTSDRKVVTPPKKALVLSTYAPAVIVSSGGAIVVTPPKRALVLTTYPPFVKLESAARTVALAHRLDASSAPTVNDDTSRRFSRGSVWIDTTTGRVYQCTDASVGAAVWRHLSSGGSPIGMGRPGVFATVMFSGPNGGTIGSTFEKSQATPVPAAGRLTAFAMAVVVAPAAGSTVDVTLRLNGVDVVGSALAFTDADAEGTVKTAQFLEPVAFGDKISVRYSEPPPNVQTILSSMVYWQGD